MYNKEFKQKYYDDFKTRLRQYSQYEIIASEKVMAHFKYDTVQFNNDYKYDFITNYIKFEIKTDTNTSSPYFYIAYFDLVNNKPSQIMTTESDYYIINNKINYYMICTKFLRDLCDNGNYVSVKNRDKTASGFLIPKTIIIENSIIL
jgi:hypothetical protein